MPTCLPIACTAQGADRQTRSQSLHPRRSLSAARGSAQDHGASHALLCQQHQVRRNEAWNGFTPVLSLAPHRRCVFICMHYLESPPPLLSLALLLVYADCALSLSLSLSLSVCVCVCVCVCARCMVSLCACVVIFGLHCC